MLFHQRSTSSSARLSPWLRSFMPAILNIVWNGYKKFKNDPNNVKPSRGVILCDTVAWKNTKLGILIVYKKPSQNDLSCSRFHGFRSKWPMLYAESRHSLWCCAHIMHVCGHWYGEQCCRRKFSFLSHGKALFHFPSAKNGSFCEVTTKMPFQNATVLFS